MSTSTGFHSTSSSIKPSGSILEIQSVFTSYRNQNYTDGRSQNDEVNITEKKKEVKHKQKKLKNFVDLVTAEETIKIDESLLKFLIYLKGDVNLVKCQYFIDLIKDLRPSYKIPDVHKLLKNVLPEVYTKYMNSKSNFQCTGVLLVSK